MTNQEIEHQIKEEIERCKEHYKKELDSYWLGRIDALNFVSMLNDLKSKNDIIEKSNTKIKLSKIMANKKMVIHTPLERQAKALCTRLYDFGFNWKETYWEQYEENTCYCPKEDSFGDTIFYSKNDYQIIEFEDVDLEN